MDPITISIGIVGLLGSLIPLVKEAIHSYLSRHSTNLRISIKDEDGSAKTIEIEKGSISEDKLRQIIKLLKEAEYVETENSSEE